MDRRSFIQASLASCLLPAGAKTLPLRAAGRPRPRILLRSSWQTVNIGDIAHTPGVLRLLELYLPQAEVTLWPNRLDNSVDRMLLTHFPQLRVADDTAAVADAFSHCDFLLHGSGPSLVAERDVVRWAQETGKPYGIYGITLSSRSSSATSDTPHRNFLETLRVLSQARL